MSEKSELIEKAVAKAEEKVLEHDNPIRVECTMDDRDDNYLLFKRRGWTFKHLRLWESTPGVENLVGLLIERLVGWYLTDDEREEIPFAPLLPLEKMKKGEEPKEPVADIEAFDRLNPAQAAWVVTAFRMAYYQSSMPDPNA